MAEAQVAFLVLDLPVGIDAAQHPMSLDQLMGSVASLQFGGGSNTVKGRLEEGLGSQLVFSGAFLCVITAIYPQRAL
jgi:hypothetical protein